MKNLLAQSLVVKLDPYTEVPISKFGFNHLRGQAEQDAWYSASRVQAMEMLFIKYEYLMSIHLVSWCIYKMAGFRGTV